MPDRVSLIDHPTFLEYDFGEYHPLRPERLETGLGLLEAIGIYDPGIDTPEVSPATVEELESVHDERYIDAVIAAGGGDGPPAIYRHFGLSSNDNPPFPDMHHASAAVTGGTVLAGRQIMNGEILHAFNPAGGLHHAQRARAAGFCIYNDPAVAAALMVREFGARVFYLDLDCHHGDGVQWIFYDNPSVFTLSFHETGRFLFPGTGDVHETGTGAGVGTSANVPFVPFTEDDSWRNALYAVVPELVRAYAPDIIISNHGCDTHDWDPLTHLSLSTASFVTGARLVHELAHEVCEGRWLAVGSGGYDWRRVVPRSWAILWSEMSERPLPDMLPDVWRARWEIDSEEPMPDRFADEVPLRHIPRRGEIEESNWKAVTSLLDRLGLTAPR